MPFELPPLPYDLDALAPHLSRETLELHHDKHHLGYVTKLNQLIHGSPDAGSTLDEIVKQSDGPLFNQAGQHWNHSFYWQCMSPTGGGRPSGELAERIGSSFGSYEKFARQFVEAASSQFGSGWTWLVDDGTTDLAIVSTSNADLPLVHDARALLTVDVWEHAYYVDYRNRRPDYVETFLGHLVNWDFAAANLAAAAPEP